MISIVILTHNESVNIGPCIESVHWCDDIHVIDAYSSDDTAQIAQTLGAKVHKRAFTSHADQHNWAHTGLDLKHPWVLHLDADERSTDAFYEDILSKVSNASPTIQGFYCCWKLMLFGCWVKHGDCFPRWQLRLVRKSCTPYISFGHAQKEASFKTYELGYIKEPYLHYAFNKGWAYWYSRHNHYSTNEAKERLSTSFHWKDLLSTHKSKRVFALKAIAHKIPFWPFIRFFYSYCLRLGFLDGKAGYIYCLEMAHYEMMISIKMLEMKHLGNNDYQKDYTHYCKKEH